MSDLSFEPIRMDALPVLRRFVPECGNGDCNTSPAALIGRALESCAKWALLDNSLIIKRNIGKEHLPCFTVFGEVLGRDALAGLEEFARREYGALRFFDRIDDITKAILKHDPYRNFSVTTSKDLWDYLYCRETFATLAGRKLHGKRNFAKRFWTNHPNAEFRVIDENTMRLCRDFLARWYGQAVMNDSLKAEQHAIEEQFANFSQLGLFGGVLCEGEQVFGFTYGALVRYDMFAVHIEKADRDQAGSYPVVASELARLLPESVCLLNREEDLGIPGLRKAKEDWCPVQMLEKGIVTVES